MNLTKALTELSKSKIGIHEAATLFLCSKGATLAQLAEAFGVDKRRASVRITAARNKQLVQLSQYIPSGEAVYQPGTNGERIIKAVTDAQ